MTSSIFEKGISFLNVDYKEEKQFSVLIKQLALYILKCFNIFKVSQPKSNEFYNVNNSENLLIIQNTLKNYLNQLFDEYEKKLLKIILQIIEENPLKFEKAKEINALLLDLLKNYQQNMLLIAEPLSKEKMKLQRTENINEIHLINLIKNGFRDLEKQALEYLYSLPLFRLDKNKDPLKIVKYLNDIRIKHTECDKKFQTLITENDEMKTNNSIRSEFPEDSKFGLNFNYKAPNHEKFKKVIKKSFTKRIEIENISILNNQKKEPNINMLQNGQNKIQTSTQTIGGLCSLEVEKIIGQKDNEIIQLNKDLNKQKEFYHGLNNLYSKTRDQNQLLKNELESLKTQSKIEYENISNLN